MRLSGNTDCHTSDIGHWFAMTETDFVYSLCGAPQAVRRFFRFFHSDVSVSHFAVEVFHRIADIERRRDGERVLVNVVMRVMLGDAGVRFVRIA